jgi:hypothetical protein
MKIKPGTIFYGCYPYTDENGKVEITVDEWVVRSIRKKRNSQTRYGIPLAYPDTQDYVNLVQKYDGLTWSKTGWLKNISPMFRRQFVLGGDLPHDLFTTPLQALKYAEKIADTPGELKAVRTRITKLRNSKK